MLVIRLFRVGKKNQPSFKIVVTDKRRPPRAGRFVEEVGFYNPLTKEKVLRGERIKYWLSVGAKPSAMVFNLLVKEGILEGKRISVYKVKKKGEASPIEKPAEEKLVEEPPKNRKKVGEKKEEKAKEEVAETGKSKEETSEKEKE